MAAISDINALIERNEKLVEGEHSSAAALQRDAFVIARNIFSDGSPYVETINSISFRPTEGIYNKEHYRNRDAWNGGVSALKNVLEAMRLEKSIIDRESEEIAPDITLRWLIKHLPRRYWLSIIGILTLGFALGKNDFFVKLFDLFRESTSP